MIFRRDLYVPVKIYAAGGTSTSSHDMNLIKWRSVSPRSHTQAEIQAVGQNIPDSVSLRNNSETRDFFPGETGTGMFCPTACMPA